MLEVRQFRYSRDNFSYLVYGDSSGLVIDGGAVEEILDFLSIRQLDLEYVTNTHGHSDHTIGNARLLKVTGAMYLSGEETAKTSSIPLDNQEIHVLSTPGHTKDSVLFSSADVLITGDTLFNGTVGNCFSGDLDGFYHSITRILEYPRNTRIYAGHDYVRESLAYGKILEPENKAIDLFLQSYDPEHVVSTLGEELEINPFLRFNEPSIIEFIEKQNLPAKTPLERWRSLML